ncbi:MAG: hypothetical protein OEY41_15485, partial [Acidimicrobiia bacterium]|nr:hypothetical protein [Acidimicrobiia bacterium]
MPASSPVPASPATQATSPARPPPPWGDSQANARDARQVAEEARRDLTRDENFPRIIILIAGLNVAVGQLVPLWVGSELIEEVTPTADETVPGG